LSLSTPKIILHVNKGNFTPIPKVDSALVEFIPKKTKYDEGFFKFVKILFQFKNKKVRNALVYGRRHWTAEKDKRKLKPLLEKMSKKKVVTLSPNELLKEYDLFQELFIS
jgi:16S rRNA A1518/A1519 N6-dimethyltransferase RsmA/KsgA/DIM1 with predicted DNA glycosylase/AP lyase activity